LERITSPDQPSKAGGLLDLPDLIVDANGHLDGPVGEADNG
jgi:hypothetical protein